MKRVLILSLIIITFSLISIAQETGTVKGKVRNNKGNGIDNVTITARQNGKDIKSVNSNAKGEFNFDLEAGVYNFVFEKNGFSSGTLYNVEIKKKKSTDLGDRLVLGVDQGSLVLIKGSIFDQDGRSIGGAKVEIEKISDDGNNKKLGSRYTSYGGEFTFRFNEGAAKYRITASAKGFESGSKEIVVDSAAIYRLAISLQAKKE